MFNFKINVKRFKQDTREFAGNIFITVRAWTKKGARTKARRMVVNYRSIQVFYVVGEAKRI